MCLFEEFFEEIIIYIFKKRGMYKWFKIILGRNYGNLWEIRLLSCFSIGIFGIMVEEVNVVEENV